jgi:hypothetical protein
MVKRDLSLGLPPAGTYRVRISSVTLKRSRKGDQMLVVGLLDDKTGDDLCQDYWMLEGKGIRSGNQKLQAFGMDPTAAEFDETDLVGRCGYAAIVVENNPAYGPQLKVNGKAEFSLSGYWSEDSPPLDYSDANPIAPLEDEGGLTSIANGPDVPF